jgi:hypothetical protein
MSTRAVTAASLAQFVIPLLFAVAVSACGSAKGRCSNNTGTESTTLGTQVTEGACRELCQEQLMRDDCTWIETIISSRIVGPEQIPNPRR